jgi:N-6 DNA Methylase
VAFCHSLEIIISALSRKTNLEVPDGYGGEEERGILNNFPADMQTAETALLFLQLIMRKLKRPLRGKPERAAVVVPNGILFGDGVCARIKEELLKEFNLHTIVRLPEGTFAPTLTFRPTSCSSTAPARAKQFKPVKNLRLSRFNFIGR